MSTEKQEEVQQEKPEQENEQAQKEESDSDDQGHGHDHDHDGDPASKKSNRGEKKFKKAMLKLGMKSVPGINRVTIKKGKSVLLYIDEPEILKSPTADNSYIVFGEAKINDFAQNMAMQEAGKFRPQKPATEEQPAGDVKEGSKVEEQVSEEGLDVDDINMIMDHCKVSKVEAIKALREADGDKVNAILKLSDK